MWPKIDVRVRLFSKSVRNGDCAEWTATLSNDGYGMFRYEGQMRGAHRVAYGIMVAPVPKGLTIDHLCRNRACVNPAHMEVVTNRVNIMRGDTPAARNAARTHCAHGHPFDEANTYHSTDKKGRHGRGCRACGRISTAAYIARKKERVA